MADDRPLLIVSGIGPGHTGVGRLIAHLQASLAPGDRLVFRQAKGQSPRMLLATGRWIGLAGEVWTRLRQRARWRRTWTGLDARAHPGLLVIHPHSLGCDLVLDLCRSRPLTAVYLMDNAAICRSSYNHRAGAPCLACVGTDGSPGRLNGCAAFPAGAAAADRLVAGLGPLARAGRLRLLAQNPGQARIHRTHFGDGAAIREVGLWSDDWEIPPTGPSGGEEVVFHGLDHPAKGSRWAIEVARALPSRTFLFPFAAPAGVPPPANARFRPCTWESGLGAAVRDARITLAPSLWSAPVEGALVKSLRWSRATAVVAAPDGYAGDLPASIRLVLPSDPASAAARLAAALDDGWRPDPAGLAAWWSGLRGDRPLIDRLRAAVHG